MDDERTRLLAILDGVDEPVLIVDHAGQVIKANGPFTTMIGEDPLVVPDAMRRRATTDAFSAELEIGTGRFRVEGMPLDGRSGPGGALILRPR